MLNYKKKHILNSMKSLEDIFERRVVEEIISLYEAKGIKHTEFARMMYGNTSTAPSKWWKIRNTSPTGKPQLLTIPEAVRAAQLLEIDIASLFFRVQEKIKVL